MSNPSRFGLFAYDKDSVHLVGFHAFYRRTKCSMKVHLVGFHVVYKEINIYNHQTVRAVPNPTFSIRHPQPTSRICAARFGSLDTCEMFSSTHRNRHIVLFTFHIHTTASNGYMISAIHFIGPFTHVCIYISLPELPQHEYQISNNQFSQWSIL